MPTKKPDQIPFRIHPRVFAALGADLVTNDVVAVIELVKNSYDAYARDVHIRFGESPEHGPFLEILDDGFGMPREIIENAWCLVATPNKQHNPVAKSGDTQRRVAGEKGLGRLSAARLGDRLLMKTKASDDICWEVEVNWPNIADGDDLSRSFATCKPCKETVPTFPETGTCIRIYDLLERWDDKKICDLEDNLARLISPFSGKEEFRITLARSGEDESEKIEINVPDFLLKPKYKIHGNVDKSGNIKAHYEFMPIKADTPREKTLQRNWQAIYGNIQDENQSDFSEQEAHCGPFEFEIRAWDIAAEDTLEISERFDFPKSKIRASIRAHKGISVYRDNVLVLPKSENARDWLGLDLRRVSRVGVRLSTNQVVGYVSISAGENPQIEDTSDRERLASCREVSEFEEILKSIVDLLETERSQDREDPEHTKPLQDLFESMDATNTIEKIEALAEDDQPAEKTIPVVREFGRALDSTRNAIQKRFVYYSRLATVGTIAHMLVHEIRNRTFTFGAFLDIVKDRLFPLDDEDMRKKYQQADRSVDSLERLADTFSPLASHKFKPGKRHSIVEDQIRECLALQAGEIGHNHIEPAVPDSQTSVAVDPGELDAILLNLIMNSIYWMKDVPADRRELKFNVEPVDGDAGRIRVRVQDSGLGVEEDDVERIFLPGMTRKPNGIGMGLTVASELVSAHGGRMRLEYGEDDPGASFAFDLPLSKRK